MPAKGRQPRRPRVRTDPASENRKHGLDLIRRHPLFAPLAYRAVWSASQDDDQCPPGGWAMATSLGYVYLNPRRRGEPEEWAWVAAHCLLHLGFDHLAEQHLAGWRAATGLPSRVAVRSGAAFDAAWNLAACVTVNRFLSHLKVGRPPEGLGGPTSYDHLAGATAGEDALAERGPQGQAVTCAGRGFPRLGAGEGRRTGPTCLRPGWPARLAPPWMSR